MRYQRGSLIVDGIIALVVLGMIAGAVVWANHFIYVTWEEPAEKRGAANQLAVDAPVLEKVKGERDDALRDKGIAEGNAATCKASLAAQSKETLAYKKSSDAAIADSHALREKQKATAPIHQAAVERWQTIASSAADKTLSCEARLAKSDAIIDEQLRIRRGLPTKPVPK